MIDLPSNWLHTGAAVLAGGAVLSVALQWLDRSLDAGRYRWQRALRARLGVAPDARITELRWVTFALQLSLWAGLGYLLLRLWGLDDLGAHFIDTLLDTGVKVGSATVVPGKVLGGLIAFLLLVTFTRWFKRKLEGDWLPRTGMEPSLRMSVATLYGYVTFIIAVLVGLSAAGLDLSKVALVAGALSVGIGFGLQNIVNNFVSGLILLFERPVRLGDYVRAGGVEGFVRQIRIRSTELENGDRVSIIVPNSVLIGATVENWNYRNSLGRVSIALKVSHNTDAQLVRRVMLEVANAHPGVIKDGEPFGVGGPGVTFKELAENGLLFELGANVRDTLQRGGVASDLRFELLRRIRDEQLPIVFPQQEIWLRRMSRDGELPMPPPEPQADERRDLGTRG